MYNSFSSDFSVALCRSMARAEGRRTRSGCVLRPPADLLFGFFSSGSHDIPRESGGLVRKPGQGEVRPTQKPLGVLKCLSPFTFPGQGRAHDLKVLHPQLSCLLLKEEISQCD